MLFSCNRDRFAAARMDKVSDLLMNQIYKQLFDIDSFSHVHLLYRDKDALDDNRTERFHRLLFIDRLLPPMLTRIAGIDDESQ